MILLLLSQGCVAVGATDILVRAKHKTGLADEFRVRHIGTLDFR